MTSPQVSTTQVSMSVLPPLSRDGRSTASQGATVTAEISTSDAAAASPYRWISDAKPVW